MNHGWTANQYRIFRMMLGAYLFVHFSQLLPWGGEVFSNAGMLADAAQSPLFGIVPNVLSLVDTPPFVGLLIVAAMVAASAFILGYRDKLAALFLWYVLACLFARNPLIANPALPYVGWMLLAHLVIPPLPRGAVAGGAASAPVKEWEISNPLFTAAWIVLALAYSYSGYTKFLSPSWVSGDAIGYVLQNPLARDYFLRDWFVELPPSALRLLTWGVMGLELLFAPLALVRKARPMLWSAMLIVQLGFLCLLNFADLTIPMLLFHLLTFDPNWIRSKQSNAQEWIFFDGTCGFCHHAVRFVMAEDRAGLFLFSPLQGRTFRQRVPEEDRRGLPDSLVLIDQTGRVLLRSDAVIHIATRLGGIWRVFGAILVVVPKLIRDAGYRLVGVTRHQLFPKPASSCPAVPPRLRARFTE